LEFSKHHPVFGLDSARLEHRYALAIASFAPSALTMLVIIVTPSSSVT
jgi:hypothetical protein